MLHKVYPRPGVPEVWSLLKAVYYWKVRKSINCVRTPLFGVKEQYRNKGIDAVLLYYGLRAIIDSGYYHSDAGWILEVNEKVIRVLRSMGQEIYKTHRFYERKLTSNSTETSGGDPDTQTNADHE